MKKTIIYGCLTMAIGLVSCQDTNKGTSTTTNADTAVLITDPSNSLNASPVNDTRIIDTVHNQQ